MLMPWQRRAMLTLQRLLKNKDVDFSQWSKEDKEALWDNVS